jgi:hypothetical protein
MLQFQPQALWNVFILRHMARGMALKQKQWIAKPVCHAPPAHSPPPPIVGVPCKTLNYHFLKFHYQASPHRRKLLSTTYSILRQSFVLNRLLYFSAEYIPLHRYITSHCYKVSAFYVYIYLTKHCSHVKYSATSRRNFTAKCFIQGHS